MPGREVQQVSNRIRELLRARQDAMLAMAKASRPIDLDDYREDLREQLAQAILADRMSPVPLGEERLTRMYAPLMGQSMSRQLLERYAAQQRRTLQNEMAQGGSPELMAPMISSVMQLDR
jgi:hypothetical protein